MIKPSLFINHRKNRKETNNINQSLNSFMHTFLFIGCKSIRL